MCWGRTAAPRQAGGQDVGRKAPVDATCEMLFYAVTETKSASNFVHDQRVHACTRSTKSRNSHGATVSPR
eukprot:12918506-Prorocentrum_lima.AAC.1